MRIERITKIKKHRVFADFSWPDELTSFTRFNLIFGWNGSGKTTLSNLFRALERRENVTVGEVTFGLTGTSVSGSQLSTQAALPNVRVFNRAFVDTNVFNDVGSLHPILVLGEKSIEKQKALDVARSALVTAKSDFIKKLAGKKAADNDLDQFTINEAAPIKDLLSSSPQNKYNNYNKAAFRQKCESLATTAYADKVLDDTKKQELRKQKDGSLMEAIAKPVGAPVDTAALSERVLKLLNRTVVSQVIKELAENPSLATWVREGLEHHTGDKHTDACHFCGNGITEGRLVALQSHFNDQYNAFLSEIDEAIAAVTKAKGFISSLNLPSKQVLYEQFAVKYAEAKSAITAWSTALDEFLAALDTALRAKRGKPFEELELSAYIEQVKEPIRATVESDLSKLADCIAQHNATTDNFQKSVETARTLLEESHVANALPKFGHLRDAATNADKAVTDGNNDIKTLNDEIVKLEAEILEYRRPAKELNKELRSYLGRSELTFSVKDTGYAITRYEEPAGDLSEGEKTAIALLYFLKSLDAKDFAIDKDVVVIDDPVSSLDSNALYCAFGYIQERTKNAGQLFILTHNFSFFRQVKNWFDHTKGKNNAALYMLDCKVEKGIRNGSLTALDPLLAKYESEYHYLYKQITEGAAAGEGLPLDAYYSLPNMARRLLETFLAFRYPSAPKELRQQLEKVITTDAAKKSRILRFVHTHSHDGKIDEQEHDMSILAETPSVLADLIALMEAEDSTHCKQMKDIVSPKAN